MNIKKSKVSILNTKYIEEKIAYFQNIIKNTILSCQKFKILNILTGTQVNICCQTLEKLFIELKDLLSIIVNEKDIDHNAILNRLQKINDELSAIIKNFGTLNINDLILICLGQDFLTNYILKNNNTGKYDLISKYCHPINYKVISWKRTKDLNSVVETNSVVDPNTLKDNTKKENVKMVTIQKNRIVDDTIIIEQSQTLDCFDLARTSQNFQTRVCGIKTVIQDSNLKQTLIIYCIVDDILVQCLNYPYIINKIVSLKSDKPTTQEFLIDAWPNFLDSLILKDLLVYDNKELYDKYIGYIGQINSIKQKTINQVVKEFISSELYSKRTILIQLLLKTSDPEFQYLAYLLYDLLSNDTNNTIDTIEQTILFDSLPWTIKKFFRCAMTQTIEYTNNLSNLDNNKIPLEQRICLLKAPDNVKEKAMQKLKEVKSKTDDSGSKARQYLDGLLKIPFGIYKQEQILSKMKNINDAFKDMVGSINDTSIIDIGSKETYTNIEINNSIIYLKNKCANMINDKIKKYCIEKLNTHSNRQDLINSATYLNILIKKHNLKRSKICLSGKSIQNITSQVHEFINNNIKNKLLIDEIIYKYNYENFNYNMLNNITSNILNIEKSQAEINAYINNVSTILDKAVHGHVKAKRQIERIIGQWINGDKSGYCFGFEGPPGVGKTSLAKYGIANCLVDENNESRAFSFIAIGGSSNGSILDGHNYTYVGSNWGKIVDILIDKKCMNPIIFIDELDKISNTEQGKELIGILTHLVDSTQNDAFQDKYFNGIDLDLSKALFIFSYNDAEKIDSILLDRIHRIKFEHLTVDDKLVVVKEYLLPEIYKKMGLNNIIEIPDQVIEFIISKYTCESGVRKLKELLFEIIGDINLSILKNDKHYELPIIVSIEDIKNIYLKDRHEINNVKIIDQPKVGIINGMWANSLGKGGILYIECYFFATTTFYDLKLTGMQGDVMKESMAVAKTLAWSLLSKAEIKSLVKNFKETNMQGIHIHVPGGSKDGPSAGTAISIALYSLLTNKPIKNNVAITGEICLQGNVTAIGGLDLKILGGLHAQVTTFIFPKSNHKDYVLFMEKYSEKDIVKGITFIEVETIQEVLKHVFVN